MQEDLDLFFTDFGVAVSFGDVRTRGVLGATDQLLDEGLQASDTHTLLLKTADFTILPVAGDLIMVDGVAYEVNIPFVRVDDGKIGRVGLQRPI